MLIAVNLHPFTEHGGGTRYFVQSLLETLCDTRYHESIKYTLISSHSNYNLINSLFLDSRGFSIVLEDDLCEFLKSNDFDLYFSPLNNLDPFPKHLPTVACLMDIQEQYMPEFFSEGDLNARHIIYPRICSEATLVCTISNFCKNSFIEKFSTQASKIQVVYLSPQKKLLNAVSEAPEISIRLSKYILYPSSFYPHKNHINLLKGYKKCIHAKPNFPNLVLVGSLLDNCEVINILDKDNLLKSKVFITSSCSPNILKYFYENANYVILPTLFEGFSMPLVEAIHLNAKVVANDLPVLREVARDCASYTKLNTEEEIFSFLIDNPTSKNFDFLSNVSATHLNTWDEVADRYLEIFDQAIELYNS
jgi:glycosyltransferase involved in cell wall biosynthesis